MDSVEGTLPHSLAGLIADRQRVVRGAGVFAALVVAVRTTLRILHNLPFDPVAVPPTMRAALSVGTPLVLGAATVAVALAAERPPARVGLLFAGVFGPLVLVSPAATLPAVVAVLAGGSLALLGSLDRSRTYRDLRRFGIAVAFTAGVAISLGSAVGILANMRGPGAAFTLGAIAALGLLVEGDRTALAAGALAFVGITAGSAASPYVTGSALLVGFSVVGVPTVLVALAAASCTALSVAGVRRGRVAPVAGVGLLVFAGVPVTLPRATAVLVGATLVLVGPERLTTRRDGEEVTA